jgi:hypothetical protein
LLVFNPVREQIGLLRHVQAAVKRVEAQKGRS